MKYVVIILLVMADNIQHHSYFIFLSASGIKGSTSYNMIFFFLLHTFLIKKALLPYSL